MQAYCSNTLTSVTTPPQSPGLESSSSAISSPRESLPHDLYFLAGILTLCRANYEYCVYWIFYLDGTIQLEIKLTGILNTYSLNPGEDAAPWGTEVYPGVNAHNHQHLFCLRIDPSIDGDNNTVMQVDALPSEEPVGSAGNPYGNAFYAKKTKLATMGSSMCDYSADTSRTWDIANPNCLNPYSKKPTSYKLVSREVPRLMPKEGSLVWKRGGFARHAIHVTKCKSHHSMNDFK